MNTVYGKATIPVGGPCPPLPKKKLIAPADYSEGNSSTPYQTDNSKFKPLAPCRLDPCESTGFKWKGSREKEKEKAMPKETFTWSKEEKKKFMTKMKK